MPGTPAALFDFDHTLLRGDSFLLFARYLLQQRRDCLRDTLRLLPASLGWALRLVSLERAKNSLLRLTAGIPNDRLDHMYRAFHQEQLLPRYSAAGRERVRWHRAQNHRLILVSASIYGYLEIVRQELGMDLLICSSTNAVTRAIVPGTHCHGRAKVRLLQGHPFFAGTDWQASWAYGDSFADRFMLELCGHPVAVNPDRRLRAWAKRDGWAVVDWSEARVQNGS